MDRELFTKHIRNEGIIIIPRSDPEVDVCLLGDFKRIKGFFKYIDFNCQINPKGGCKEQPETLKCCCSGCYSSAGYFRRMVDTDITKYARHFSVKTGYWRKGKGCILHHTMRSTTCLTHHCNNDGKEDFSHGMMTLRHRLNDLRSSIYKC